MRWDIGNDELALSNAISDPVKPHVDSFTAFLFDAVCCDANSGCVIAHNDGGLLRVTHVG